MYILHIAYNVYNVPSFALWFVVCSTVRVLLPPSGRFTKHFLAALVGLAVAERHSSVATPRPTNGAKKCFVNLPGGGKKTRTVEQTKTPMNYTLTV